MVLAVLSSRMSAGGCSLAGHRDNVPCLGITAIFPRAKIVFLFLLNYLNVTLKLSEKLGYIGQRGEFDKDVEVPKSFLLQKFNIFKMFLH